MLPPETAHTLGLQLLKCPIRLGAKVADPWTWNSLTFRNKVGIAAGFDKNAVALAGLERLGVGFVEIGTILVEPWPGNPKPRLKRLPAKQGIWNRLGFPSDGVQLITQRLASFPRDQRHGMLVFCNIGPHPGHLKSCNSPESYLQLAREELCVLVDQLHPHSDGFVINLSSPNTAGLRGLFCDPRLAQELMLPVYNRVRSHANNTNRWIPVLIKLPPEDQDKLPWTRNSLESVLLPLLKLQACDGFVAVNTSTHLSQELLKRDMGGISGGPLLPLALCVIELLRSLIGDEMLILGCGGITRPEDCLQLQKAGAQLVELYSGMIYEGPGFPSACASVLKNAT
ncbi:MAG TPA: dihydroorotate dehydrogenase 2 [Gemmatales bacterium]|nr:dihydroorotate dehydrogenase 2 [Gemmatales bacterium]